MLRFAARVVIEGSKSAGKQRSRRITVPADVVRSLRAKGAHLPGWLRIQVDGGAPLFVFGRRPKSRPSVDVVLPTWRFGRLRRGTTVDVKVTSADPFRARTIDTTRFDWLAFLPKNPRYFPTQNKAALSISYRREPIAFTRWPDETSVYWMLGFYQAEGAKRSSKEWSVVSSNSMILRGVVKLLTALLGVSRDRLHLDVLHAPGDDPVEAQAQFAGVGARINTVYVRVPHKKWRSSGGRGAVLHVARSFVLYQMVMAALRQIFKIGFPSREAARAFALGWLEGDGSIHINKAVTLLRLHAGRAEVHLVLDALHGGFDWIDKCGEHDDARFTSERSLTAPEACALAQAGAFAYSMNRARLLYAVENRSLSVRASHAQHGARSFTQVDGIEPGVLRGLVLPGLLEREAGQLRLTASALRLCENFPLLLPEIQKLRRFSPPELLGKTGVKCAPYPKELLEFNSNRIA